jgi:hypothetical protein
VNAISTADFMNQWEAYPAERLYELYNTQLIANTTEASNSSASPNTSELTVVEGRLESGENLETLEEFQTHSLRIFGYMILIGLIIWWAMASLPGA